MRNFLYLSLPALFRASARLGGMMRVCVCVCVVGVFFSTFSRGCVYFFLLFSTFFRCCCCWFTLMCSYFRCQFDSVLILIRIHHPFSLTYNMLVCVYIRFPHPSANCFHTIAVRDLPHTLFHSLIRLLAKLMTMMSKLASIHRHTHTHIRSHSIPTHPSHSSIQIQFRTYYVITYFQFSRKMKKVHFTLSRSLSFRLSFASFVSMLHRVFIVNVM